MEYCLDTEVDYYLQLSTSSFQTALNIKHMQVLTSELYQLEVLLHIAFKGTGFRIVTDSVRVLHNYYIAFQYFESYKLVNQQCHVKIDFMVTPCISDIKHFIVQLMHTTLKIRRVIKIF